MSNNGSSGGGGTKYIKAVCAVVADIMVGIFTPWCDRAGITDINYDNPLFDMPLPMI